MKKNQHFIAWLVVLYICGGQTFVLLFRGSFVRTVTETVCQSTHHSMVLDVGVTNEYVEKNYC